MGLPLAACSGESGASGGSGPITLGYISSWTDGLSMAHLIDNRLTAMGYEVEHEQVYDNAFAFTALAGGDVDIHPSAWPEVTHASYMDEHQDSIEDLGAYYDNATLSLSVPEYSSITSIADLEGQGERFGHRIVGIEPGVGLTQVTADSVMPSYALGEEYELVTSSTPAMLSELQSAVDAAEDIIVTLWQPYWANSAFPVKDLEDPEGALGDGEALHSLARPGFREQHPEAADYIGRISLDDEQYRALEDLVVNEFGEGEEAEAVEAWLEEHPDVLPPLP